MGREKFYIILQTILSSKSPSSWPLMSTSLHYCNVLSQPLALCCMIRILKVFQARYLMIKYKIKFRTESNVMSALEQNSVLYYLTTKVMGNLRRCQRRDIVSKREKKGKRAGKKLLERHRQRSCRFSIRYFLCNKVSSLGQQEDSNMTRIKEAYRVCGKCVYMPISRTPISIQLKRP